MGGYMCRNRTVTDTVDLGVKSSQTYLANEVAPFLQCPIQYASCLRGLLPFVFNPPHLVFSILIMLAYS